MDDVEYYRERAIECLLRSLDAEDISSRILLLRLSQAWLELAEQGLSSPISGSEAGPNLTSENP